MPNLDVSVMRSEISPSMARVNDAYRDAVRQFGWPTRPGHSNGVLILPQESLARMTSSIFGSDKLN